MVLSLLFSAPPHFEDLLHIQVREGAAATPSCRSICLERTRLLPHLHHHLLAPSIQKLREGIAHTQKKPNNKTNILPELTARLFFYRDSSSMLLFWKARLSRSCAAASQAKRGGNAPSLLPEQVLPARQPLPFHTVGMEMPLTAHHQDILLHQ